MEKTASGGGIRLNKYLADCGVCSRRQADRYLEEGRVTVDGAVAGVGARLSGQACVCLDGRPVGAKKDKVVLAYYKPAGVTCTEKDRHAGLTIRDAVDYPVRVTYAGRLDRDSEGLLLLTNDGQLIQDMMKGSRMHEKEYVVRVRKEVTPDFLRRMESGVYLPELEQTTRPCRAIREGRYTFRLILTQGLNRQIRRMCRALGQEVVWLRRVRVLNITLDGLTSGAYREICGEELERLYREAGAER